MLCLLTFQYILGYIFGNNILLVWYFSTFLNVNKENLCELVSIVSSELSDKIGRLLKVHLKNIGSTPERRLHANTYVIFSINSIWLFKDNNLGSLFPVTGNINNKNNNKIKHNKRWNIFEVIILVWYLVGWLVLFVYGTA